MLEFRSPVGIGSYGAMIGRLSLNMVSQLLIGDKFMTPKTTNFTSLEFTSIEV